MLSTFPCIYFFYYYSVYDMTGTNKIVIVGGGISGLYAAYKLLKLHGHKDIDIAIIEKNDRLGGRIHTVKHDNVIIDAGAARFNKNHKLLIDLIKDLNLTRFVLPLKSNKVYRKDARNIKINVDKYVQQAIRSASKYDKKYLEGITFKMYLQELFGNSIADNVVYAFGYNTEFEVMNANDAIETFKQDFLENIEYFTLVGGLSMIIEELSRRISKHTNCKVYLNTFLKSHRYDKKTRMNTLLLASHPFQSKNHFHIKSNHTYFCVPKRSLLGIEGLVINDQALQRSLGTIGASPLLKIFAKFPGGEKCWFHDIKRTTTNGSLRYIIPLNYKEGVILISYTEGYHARVLNEVPSEILEAFILRQLRHMYPGKKIQAPLWLKKYYWDEGAHYWKQNPEKYEQQSRKYTICGEVVANRNHGWIEGALGSVIL